METRTSFLFAPFRLDVSSEQLWRDDQVIALRPKTFAVLRYLVEHPGQLVTKDELLDVVWAGTVVSDTVLKSCIRELRMTLDDAAESPQYIATVHRRGYRWVAADAAPVPGSRFHAPGLPATKTQPYRGTLNVEHGTLLVGREAELTQLHSWLEKALHGERQLVFVTGEPGIGKTTLVDAFLAKLEAGDWRLAPSPQASNLQPQVPSVWLGWGQCIEQYGAGEAYMPILEALGRLCREPGGERLIGLLQQHAPTWLVQMPTLLEPTELEALQRKVQGATRERMLREMAEAIDAITAERPLVLWLEDLHWSDPSTLELLSLLARRREAARLLVLGTYRPVDVIVSGHPLRTVKQELQLHEHCHELAVRLLTEEAVEKYLGVRFSAEVGAQHAAPLQRLAHTIHQRTEGNPLFMVNVVDELLMQEKIDSAAIEISTPVTIRQMIEQQLERFSLEEQRVVEVASVVGMEFSAAAVAAGAAVAVEESEECCAGLARRGQFLRTNGLVDWLDGTSSTHYQFLHALYQDVTYERIPMGRRGSLHRRIGERLEGAYGTKASEIAAELAMHFEQGRDYQRAVHYLHQGGENAIQRSAYREAIRLLTKGLTLLGRLPDTLDRVQQEIALQLALGMSLMAIKGLADSGVEHAYTRARELCLQVGEPPQLFLVLRGLFTLYLERGVLRTVYDLAEQLLHLAQREQNPVHLLWAHNTMGVALFWLGEFVRARSHFEQSLALYRQQQGRGFGFVFDSGVNCLSYMANILWVLGYADQALTRSQEALTLAEGLGHPSSVAFTLDFAAALSHQMRRGGSVTQEFAEAQVALAHEQGFAQWLAIGSIFKGVALAEQAQGEEGIRHMRQGLAVWQASGGENGRPYFLAILAEAYGRQGQAKEGLRVAVEAMDAVHKTEEHRYEAELYRLKGELTLQQKNQKAKVKRRKQEAGDWGLEAGPSSSQASSLQSQAPSGAEQEAEGYFLKAIDIARRQSAKSWELRASTSLARLWQQQGKRKEAHKLLADIYGWFTEGFDTKDLQEAKMLIEELNH